MNKEQAARHQYGGMSLASWLLAVGQLTVLVVVANLVELDELLSPLQRPLSQVVVEHRLPGLGVNPGGLCQDAIEIEQAGGDSVG